MWPSFVVGNVRCDVILSSAHHISPNVRRRETTDLRIKGPPQDIDRPPNNLFINDITFSLTLLPNATTPFAAFFHLTG